MNKLFVKILILFFALFIAFPVSGFAKKKDHSKIIKKVKKKNENKLEKKHKKILGKKHEKILGKKHKKIKGKIDTIDLDKKTVTIIDKKNNIYHFDIAENQLVNKKGEKIDKNKLIKGSKLRINYDVKSKGKLEAINMKVRDGKKKNRK